MPVSQPCLCLGISRLFFAFSQTSVSEYLQSYVRSYVQSTPASLDWLFLLPAMGNPSLSTALLVSRINTRLHEAVLILTTRYQLSSRHPTRLSCGSSSSSSTSLIVALCSPPRIQL